MMPTLGRHSAMDALSIKSCSIGLMWGPVNRTRMCVYACVCMYTLVCHVVRVCVFAHVHAYIGVCEGHEVPSECLGEFELQ